MPSAPDLTARFRWSATNGAVSAGTETSLNCTFQPVAAACAQEEEEVCRSSEPTSSELSLSWNLISFFCVVAHSSPWQGVGGHAGVCASAFALCQPLPLPARQWAPVTRTLPTKRNCPFLCDKRKISNGFDQEPFECSSESHQVLYGSVALYPISVAFLARIAEDHQPFDISYQTSQQAKSQGPAVLACLGTRGFCVLGISRHFSLQSLCLLCILDPWEAF